MENSANDPSSDPIPNVSPTEVAPAAFWKTLIRCNPFYLFSALLLIYGVYRASIDPHFLSTETRQIIFNFGSLEIYGLMLVATAVFLARRKIWYDATLLLFLENVLVLIPFILIGQAVFLDSSLARTMALLGFLLVAAKLTVFKAFFSGLNLPARLLMTGALILIVNTAIPLVFRRALDSHNDLWTMRSQYCWLVLLPILALTGHVLNPLRNVPGETDEHRKEWIPLTTFLLWIAGTAAHLYSVGYVDDQKFELAKFSVLAWSISWLLCAKITLVVSRFTRFAPEIMLGLPIASVFLAFKRPELAVALSLFNAGIFAVLCLRWKAARLPAILGGISLASALFAVPDEWVTPWVAQYSKGALIFVLVNATLIVAALRMRTVKWGWVGALCVASLLIAAGQNLPFAHHYAVQAASSFLLIHSLFWKGAQERGSQASLVFATLLWVIDASMLDRTGHVLAPSLPLITGLPLLMLAVWFRKSMLPIFSAALVMLIGPLLHIFAALQNAPTGVLALTASFLLFGVGTAFAIWKRRLSG